MDQDIYGGHDYYMYTSFTLYFYVVDNTAPANPANLSVSSTGEPPNYSHPVVTWDANSEADFSGYNVYRQKDNESWITIATVTTNSYTDSDILVPIQYSKFTYKVKAFDINGNYSGYSNEDYIYGYKINKTNEGTEEEKIDQLPDEFSLSQNYPNPFNPSTEITYKILEDDFVNITVYNTIGQEVVVLVNQYQAAGEHIIQFNAENLPSGIYIYKLKSGRFIDVKKMILTK